MCKVAMRLSSISCCVEVWHQMHVHPPSFSTVPPSVAASQSKTGWYGPPFTAVMAQTSIRSTTRMRASVTLRSHSTSGRLGQVAPFLRRHFNSKRDNSSQLHASKAHLLKASRIGRQELQQVEGSLIRVQQDHMGSSVPLLVAMSCQSRAGPRLSKSFRRTMLE